MADSKASKDSKSILAKEMSSDAKESLVIVSETEKEVEDESHNDFQAKIEVLVQLGKEELRPFTISDCYTSDRPGMHLEILPKIIFDAVDEDTDIEEIDLPKPIFRQTVDTGTQASIEFSSTEVQTLKRSLVNSWSQYEPRVYTNEEMEETLNSPSMETFIEKAKKSILGTLIQNSIADSFFWDLTSLHDEKHHVQEEEELQLTITGSFSCSNTKGTDRLISYIDWHPLHKDVFVASTISCLSLERRLVNLFESPSESMLFYLWNIRNQFFSKLTLESLDDAYKLKFNPKMPNIVAAGTITGQLILWDIKQADLSIEANDNHNASLTDNVTTPAVIRYCAVSSMDHIHKHGITDLHWVPTHLEVAAKGEITKNPSNGCQIITCGLDGYLQIWDLRMGLYSKPGQAGPKKFNHLDGVWEPFHTVEVLGSEGRKRKSLTCFVLKYNKNNTTNGNLNEFEDNGEIEDVINPYENTEFYGGCDDGQVLFGSFKLMKDDSGKFVAKRPEFFNSPHGTSVTSLTCSPFIEDVFFSTGGKNLAIWKHSIKTDPIYLRERHASITAGQWSATRAAMFVLGFRDGSVEVWDLLSHLYEPYLVHFMSTSAIKSLSIQSVTETEHIIAAGDSKGIVYTLNLPPDLYAPLENEVYKFSQLMDKEATRILGKTNDLPPSNIPQKMKSKDKVTKMSSLFLSSTIKLLKFSHEVPEKTVIESEENVLLGSYEAFIKLQNKQLKLLGLTKEPEQI